MIYKLGELTPHIGENVYIAPSAEVIGDVVIGNNSSVWFQVVIRGDVHSIRIGENSNIQDLTMVHVSNGKFSTTIGNGVTVGHRAVIHGCELQDNCLIGMGSVVMDGVVIESECLVAAGSLVPPGFVGKSGTVLMGSPAKIVRDLRDEEREMIYKTAEGYAEYKERYQGEMGLVKLS